MVYRAIGVLEEKDSLFVSFAEFHENAGSWNVEIKANAVFPSGNAGQVINNFIDKNGLQYQVALIAFFAGRFINLNGAALAAETGLPVITDLPAIDFALGGNGEFLSFSKTKLNMDAVGENMDEIKKATCVAFMGVLRWREEYNFLSSITGASRNSIGGALWLGQEA